MNNMKIPSPYLADCPERDTFIFSKMIAAWGDLDGARILDMGCGTAPLAKLCYLYGKGIAYVGYDTHKMVIDNRIFIKEPPLGTWLREFPGDDNWDIAISIGIPSLASGGYKIIEDHKRINPKLVVLETGYAREGASPIETMILIRDWYFQRGYKCLSSDELLIYKNNFPVPNRWVSVLRREA